MPQLDVALYPPQLIWLIISFVLLYLAMARVALPRISEVLEKRRDRIDGDLDKATSLKNEADKALAAYEQSMAAARTQAFAVIKEASDQLAESSGGGGGVMFEGSLFPSVSASPLMFSAWAPASSAAQCPR